MAIARHGSPGFEVSPSPPHQAPLTKRDVRRKRIMEKLEGMIDTFSTNQNQHYRAQIQAVQVDMTLVLNADPYSTAGPLDDEHDEIKALIESVIRPDGNSNGITLPDDDAVKSDFWALAGKRYTDFVRESNDAIERRDADLTALHNNYDSAVAELDRIYQQRLHQAEEEHKALSATIRQRLLGTLNKKRQQLLRDKEQLDIADSNAMLLHPNHFSIGNNPGSPSNNGMAVNKRTRHLRHHRGASPAPAGAEEIGKRKRKIGQMDDDAGNESPLPYLTGGRSPFKEARSTRDYAQHEAPAYSLERLFTEKELAMATDTAKTATYKYFHQPEQRESGSNSNPTAVPSLDGEVVESAELGTDEGMADAAVNGANTPPPSEPPTAVGMERQTSHQVLTRGGAKANPLAALSDLANAAAAASNREPVWRDKPFTPVAPSFHAVTRAEKVGAPMPGGCDSLDLESDFNMMRAAGNDFPPEENNVDEVLAAEARKIRRELLDQALGVSGVMAPYRLPQLETGPGALIGRGVEREPRTGFAPVLTVATIESRLKNSAANLGIPGGSLAAALSGRLGAETMSRTTSAGGVSEPGDAAGPGRRGGRGKLV